MNFTDQQVRRCYERNFSETIGFSDNMRQVSALIATHGFFQMLEGSHSERVHETMDLLLSPILRPGLREWYRHFKLDMTSVTSALRDQLNQLAGEELQASEEKSSEPV